MNRKVGNWLGWLGIIIAVVGFFTTHLILGIVGLILGIIGLFSPSKAVNWVAIVCGVIAIILNYVL